eukprot:193496_1
MYGCSPLSLAIHFGEKKVQQILYEAGIDVSPHDARRLKKDNHIFRRFGWIKIPPSISTKVMLPDDVWCVVCGFLPCDELLLNVRLVSFGFLYVVHHPALRKLVNFKRSLPDKVDELVQYNENHQTLVLKAPSPENNFNVNAAPFAFMAPPMHPMVGGVPFAPPPPPAAAILGGHGPPPIPPGPHAPGPHPHLIHHPNGVPPPNPFGTFPHFMIPAPHHPHNPPPNVPISTHSVHRDNTNNNGGTTVQLQSSLPPPPPPPTLQSMYHNRQNMMTRPQSNSLPSVPRHHSHHRSFQSIDFDDSPENDPNDEFTPPPIQPTVLRTQSAANNTPLPQSQSDLANDANNEQDQHTNEEADTQHLNEQIANMNGHIASLILDHVAPTPPTTNTIDDEKPDTPIPSDVGLRPTPISTTVNNQRNGLTNLQTIHSQTSHPTSSDALPTSNDNTNNNNVAILNQLATQMSGDPPLLSRHYSHNNFIEHNQEFQRFMSISPPMSPSLNGAAHNTNNTSNTISNHHHPSRIPQLLQHFTPAVDTTAPPDDPSNNNTNPNDDLFIAPWNAAINNPMLNNGAHYTLNAMDAAVVMNRVDHNEDTEMVSMCSQLWSIESTQDTINWTHISTQPLIRVKRKRTRRNEIIGAIKNSGCRHIRNTTSRIATSAT